jgi:hypothetical protein
MNEASYNFIYSDVDESPDALDKRLKQMVGAKGFEPSTSWRVAVVKDCLPL